MARFNATLIFDAATLEEAEAIVSTWTVTPGTTVLPLIGSVAGEGEPVIVGESGAVSEAAALVVESPAE